MCSKGLQRVRHVPTGLGNDAHIFSRVGLESEKSDLSPTRLIRQANVGGGPSKGNGCGQMHMLLCASVLAQSGFARPRQQHRVPLTRCRVARAQVPNRPHLLRRRDPSSRLGSPIPCKPIEAESRSRGESDSRPTAHDPYGCCGSFFRPPRVPRVPRPSARPTPKEGTDPAPASRGPPHHFVPPSLTPRVSLSRPATR